MTGKKLTLKFSMNIGPSPPTSTSCPLTWWMLSGLPHFSPVILLPYNTWEKKTGEERGGSFKTNYSPEFLKHTFLPAELEGRIEVLQFDVCCKATDQNFACGCYRYAFLRLVSLTLLDLFLAQKLYTNWELHHRKTDCKQHPWELHPSVSFSWIPEKRRICTRSIRYKFKLSWSTRFSIYQLVCMVS